MTTPYTSVGGVNYRGNVPKPSGVFNPGKYPVAPGKNYGVFGEQKGWVYNPYQDTYVPDPKAQHDYAVAQGLETDPKPAPGLAETILPVAGVVAATELAKEGGKGVAGLFGAGGAAKDVAQTGLTNTAGAQVTGATAANAGANVAAGASESTGMFLGPGGGPAGQGAELAPGMGVAPYLGLAGAGLGAYGVSEAIKSGNAGQGAISGAGMGAGLAAAAPLVGLGPVGWGAMGLMALGGAGMGAGLTKLLHHETTREAEAKKTSELMSQGTDNPAWQQYVSGMRQQYSAPPPDPSKPFAGKYGSWNEYKKAGLEAPDLTGVYGNLHTFGPQWINYTPAQQQQITQALIDNNLYDSKKGDVIVTDPGKAKTLAEQVVAGKYKAAAPTPAPDATAPAGLMMSNNKVATVNPPLGQPGHQWQPGDPVYGRR